MSGKVRNLPALPELAAALANNLGDATPSVLVDGDYPATALAIGGHHHLLLRDHGHCVSVSLPTGEQHRWSWQTRDEWQREWPQVQQALTTYRARYPNAFSMADVIVVLAPALARITGTPWDISFPGTPVPSEAWCKSGERSVGLFQGGESVRVVVWVGARMESSGVASATELDKLGPWIEPLLAAQVEALELAAIEEQRKKALPLPDVEVVLERLRSGTRITSGGGRYHTTYFMEGSQLRREIFDEGHVEVRDATVDDLRQDIGYNSEDFR